MNLADLRIISGVTAGCVVDGRFTLESPNHPGGDPVSSEGAQIVFFMGGSYGAWLRLTDVIEYPPGVFSRLNASDRLTLHLPAAVDFEKLLFAMAYPPDQGRPRYLEGAELTLESAFGWVSGRIPSLRLEISVSEAGLGVSLSGEVGPLNTPGKLFEPGSPVPALADSRIHADIVIPWTFLTVQGSVLAGLGARFRPSDKPGGAPFDFRRPGLSGVAFNQDAGTPFFEGRFVVQGAIGRPYVRAQIDDKAMVLRPCGAPLLASDGFAVQSPSDPAITFTLTLPTLGYDAWSKILSGEAAGRLELKGDGIGFLTEATWMSVVAGRHTIAALSLDLALGDTELVVKLEGEVGRLLQHNGPPLPPKLGPRFETTLRVPVPFLTARDIDLLAWGQREKLVLDNSRAPN